MPLDRRSFLSARGADPRYLAACTNLGTLALLEQLSLLCLLLSELGGSSI